MDAQMPVAIVEQGTTPRQRVVTGTLYSIAEQVKQADIKAPAIIIVGTVVKLQRELAWFNPGQ
jgi:uroporphyrin-III C-methyltransferase/precorrin-2 dehydrogenase/sirohydrochlorin ferrochelatase